MKTITISILLFAIFGTMNMNQVQRDISKDIIPVEDSVTEVGVTLPAQDSGVELRVDQPKIAEIVQSEKTEKCVPAQSEEKECEVRVDNEYRRPRKHRRHRHHRRHHRRQRHHRRLRKYRRGDRWQNQQNRERRSWDQENRWKSDRSDKWEDQENGWKGDRWENNENRREQVQQETR